MRRESLKCGGEHYLKEQLEATLPHQSLCYNHHRKISVVYLVQLEVV